MPKKQHDSDDLDVMVPSAAMTIEMWPLERFIPYKKNARKWSADAVVKVANSIREFGFRQPIVVDKEGVIVIGHRRLAAALIDLKIADFDLSLTGFENDEIIERV